MQKLGVDANTEGLLEALVRQRTYISSSTYKDINN